MRAATNMRLPAVSERANNLSSSMSIRDMLTSFTAWLTTPGSDCNNIKLFISELCRL